MPAPLLLLAEVLIGLFGGYAELTAGPAGMAAIAVVAAGALLLALVVVLRPVAAGGALTPSAVRQRTERTEYLPLCDPDAAGRPRPRAPSALPGAA
jgi:hypothetical protein